MSLTIELPSETVQALAVIAKGKGKSPEDYAREVFNFFRECDRENIEIVYCETVEEKGIGAALMDRLKRASEN